MQITVLLFFVVIFECAWCQREHWVNPHDVHNYDHVNKKMKNAVTVTTSETPPTLLECSSASQLTLEALHKCQTSLREFQKESAKKDSTIKFLNALLQRQTAIILRTSGLMEDDRHDSFYVESFLHLYLTRKELNILKTFVSTGNMDNGSLDMIWTNMWSYADHPGRSKWYWLTKWLPSNPFSFSKEMFIILMGCLILIVPIVMLMLGVNSRRVFFTFFFAITVGSVIIRYQRITQVNEMRQQHMLVDHTRMPSECRPFDRNWWETFLHVFSSDKFDEKRCAAYYQARYTDPATHTTPLEQIFELVGDIIENLSGRMGTSMKDFCGAAFDDLPGPVALAVCVMVKVLSIVVFLALFGLMVWTCLHSSMLSLVSPRRYFRGEALPSQIPDVTSSPPIVQQPPIYNITNHGPLYMNGQEMLESNLSEHNRFLRSKSEGSIGLSQSTSTSDLRQINSIQSQEPSEKISRPRSQSTSTFQSTLQRHFTNVQSQVSSFIATTTTSFNSNDESKTLLNVAENNEDNESTTEELYSDPEIENPQVKSNNHEEAMDLNETSIDNSVEMIETNLDDSVQILSEQMTNMSMCTPQVASTSDNSSPSYSDRSTLSPPPNELSTFLESFQHDDSMSQLLDTPEPSQDSSPSNESTTSSYEFIDTID